jgi:molybdate transport system substrate-binding protein
MTEIFEAFNKQPREKVEAVYGSSGNFKTQILQGAPFDIFFSADIEFPRELAKAGLAAQRSSRMR